MNYFLDVNVVVGLLRSDSSLHAAAQQFWLETLDPHDSVFVTVDVCISTVRVCANPRIWRQELSVSTAVQAVSGFTQSENVYVLSQSGSALVGAFDYLTTMDLAGADAPDALLAATATERGFTLVSADQGFQRFPGLDTLRLAA